MPRRQAPDDGACLSCAWGRYAEAARYAHGHRLLFRSIDTWLDGICVNYCKECTWAERPGTVGAACKKYSLFGQSRDANAGVSVQGRDANAVANAVADAVAKAYGSPMIARECMPQGEVAQAAVEPAATKDEGEKGGRWPW